MHQWTVLVRYELALGETKEKWRHPTNLRPLLFDGFFNIQQSTRTAELYLWLPFPISFHYWWLESVHGNMWNAHTIYNMYMYLLYIYIPVYICIDTTIKAHGNSARKLTFWFWIFIIFILIVHNETPCSLPFCGQRKSTHECYEVLHCGYCFWISSILI